MPMAVSRNIVGIINSVINGELIIPIQNRPQVPTITNESKPKQNQRILRKMAIFFVAE
jgi:hypothetical protein